jgi:hypothetical protein
MRPPSSLDVAVLQVVQEELATNGDAATVRHEWSDGAGMWFVEVEPINPGAARLSVGFDGDDDLSVTVGRTWFEIFPFRESSLDEFRRLVRAIFAGRIEEAGQKAGEARARIYAERRSWTVGAFPLWPWHLRARHRYEPYGHSAPPKRP